MRIGITGSYASGKGTVTAMLVALGAVEVDTDIIAREIMQDGSPVLEKIKEEFGLKFFAEGRLDRKAFARYIFSSNERTSLLNSITHPEILKKTIEAASGDEMYAINVPLLFESGFDSAMDVTVLVSADKEQSITRGEARDGLSKNDILLRLERQMELNEKRDRADYEIDNSKSLLKTEQQVKELWNSLKEMNKK